MNRFKKILLPTELSENSRVGVSYGAVLAAQSRAELTVLHVTSGYPWSEVSEDALWFSSRAFPWLADQVVQEATLDLHRFLAIHREEFHEVPAVRQMVLLGDVVEKIVEVALMGKIDLVVMAKRRRGAFSRLISRSVSEAVSRKAACPVLSVCSGQPPASSWRGRRVPVVEPAL